MIITRTWAESLKVESGDYLPPVADYSQPYARQAYAVATRAIILHGVVAAAYDVAAGPIVKWLQEQAIWDEVTAQKRACLLSTTWTKAKQLEYRWKQEAEWTLLWMIGEVDFLGLPIHCCDTQHLVDKIIPALGDPVHDFISQAKLRVPGALLAEDDRSYSLWCHALAAKRRKEALPNDLNLAVLRERRYAFEWIDGTQNWDEVTCDA
jgi:hypothetical protein